jgi:Transposase DDE domain
MGAIQRTRAVNKASTLLRLALVYGFCGYSLRQTAAWAEASEVATLSDVALLKRFRKTPDWLGHLLGVKLASRVTPLTSNRSRLRLLDATTVNAPGSKGTDWRVHLGFDLGAMAISTVQVTQAEGGESLVRHDFAAGELVIADRGYSHRSGFAHVLASQAHFIVRFNWGAVPVQLPGGGAFELLTELRGLPEAKAAAFDLEIQPSAREKIQALPVRLVAVRKSPEAADECRKKLLRSASKRGTKIQPQTLELANYFMVLTSTAATTFSNEEVLDIYRFRWQIELVFKRLKGLMHLDQLPARDPHLARTLLYSKLLAAFLLDELTESYLSFSPWGFRLHATAPSFHLENPPSTSL